MVWLRSFYPRVVGVDQVSNVQNEIGYEVLAGVQRLQNGSFVHALHILIGGSGGIDMNRWMGIKTIYIIYNILCMNIYRSVDPSIHQSIDLSIFLSIYLLYLLHLLCLLYLLYLLHLSIYHLYLLCLSVCLSAYVYIYIYTYIIYTSNHI